MYVSTAGQSTTGAESQVTQKNREVKIFMSSVYRSHLESLWNFLSQGSPFPMPALATVDINGVCNYRCRHCIDGNGLAHGVSKTHRDMLEMPWPRLRRLVTDLKDMGVLGIEIMGGEGMLYSHYRELLEFLIVNTLPARLVTNGSKIARYLDLLVDFLSIPHSFLRVSINGGPRTYSDIKGQDQVGFYQLLHNVSRLAEKGRRIQVSFVMFKENLDEIYAVAEAVKKAGAREMLILPGRNPENKEVMDFISERRGHISDTLAKAAALNDGEFEVVIPHTLLEPMAKTADPHKTELCYSSLLKPTIGVDGSLYRCTYFRGEPDHKIEMCDGSRSFHSLWEKAVGRLLGYAPTEGCRYINCTRDVLNTFLDNPGNIRTPSREQVTPGIWF